MKSSFHKAIDQIHYKIQSSCSNTRYGLDPLCFNIILHEQDGDGFPKLLKYMLMDKNSNIPINSDMDDNIIYAMITIGMTDYFVSPSRGTVSIDYVLQVASTIFKEIFTSFQQNESIKNLLLLAQKSTEISLKTQILGGSVFDSKCAIKCMILATVIYSINEQFKKNSLNFKVIANIIFKDIPIIFNTNSINDSEDEEKIKLKIKSTFSLLNTITFLREHSLNSYQLAFYTPIPIQDESNGINIVGNLPIEILKNSIPSILQSELCSELVESELYKDFVIRLEKPLTIEDRSEILLKSLSPVINVNDLSKVLYSSLKLSESLTFTELSYIVDRIYPKLDRSKNTNEIAQLIEGGVRNRIVDKMALYPGIGTQIPKDTYQSDEFVEKDIYTFDGLLGMDKVKSKISILMNQFLSKEISSYQRCIGTMFYGPPGNGKTLLVSTLANKFGVHLITVGAAEIVHGEIGESERRIAAVYSEAIKNAPSIVFFDEMESIFGEMKNDTLAGKRIAQLISCLDNERGYLESEDGYKNKGRVFTVGATNIINRIDTRILKSGRIDTKILFEGPKDIKDIVDIIVAISIDSEKKKQKSLITLDKESLTSIATKKTLEFLNESITNQDDLSEQKLRNQFQPPISLAQIWAIGRVLQKDV